MRPSQLILLTTGLCAVLVMVSISLIHLNQEAARTEVPEEPAPSQVPPPIALNPTRPTIETFIGQYFAALNNHDFDTAYEFLSPAWGVNPKEFQQYWSKFKAGSIKSEILSIAQLSSRSAVVILRWSGSRDGKTVKLGFQCSLRATPSSYRIEQCK